MLEWIADGIAYVAVRAVPEADDCFEQPHHLPKKINPGCFHRRERAFAGLPVAPIQWRPAVDEQRRYPIRRPHGGVETPTPRGQSRTLDV